MTNSFGTNMTNLVEHKSTTCNYRALRVMEVIASQGVVDYFVSHSLMEYETYVYLSSFEMCAHFCSIPCHQCQGVR